MNCLECGKAQCTEHRRHAMPVTDEVMPFNAEEVMQWRHGASPSSARWVATFDTMTRELAEARARLEQTEVQLAGCGVAALGWNQQPAKPSDYGYSASYGDVLKLRRRMEASEAENARLREANARLREERDHYRERPLGSTPLTGAELIAKEPSCTCVRIQAADVSRHFRECPERVKYPEPVMAGDVRAAEAMNEIFGDGYVDVPKMPQPARLNGDDILPCDLCEEPKPRWQYHTLGDCVRSLKERLRASPKPQAARLDPDGTAKGKTILTAHIHSSDGGTCYPTPASVHVDAETGKRTPLRGDDPKPAWTFCQRCEGNGAIGEPCRDCGKVASMVAHAPSCQSHRGPWACDCGFEPYPRTRGADKLHVTGPNAFGGVVEGHKVVSAEGATILVQELELSDVARSALNLPNKPEAPAVEAPKRVTLYAKAFGPNTRLTVHVMAAEQGYSPVDYVRASDFDEAVRLLRSEPPNSGGPAMADWDAERDAFLASLDAEGGGK